MIRITGAMLAVLATAGMIWVWNAPVEAAVITSLELAGGSVDVEGRFARKLDRLFEQPGLLVMNEYQPGPDIVSPLTKQHRTFSLFTSGIHGALPPTATIDGSSIAADLSSLFFGVSRGEQFRAWNIGGTGTGLFNPETLEFCLTWDHLFRDRPMFGLATFSLHGKAQLAAIPLPASVGLFLSGLLCLGVTAWRWRARFQAAVM